MLILMTSSDAVVRNGKPDPGVIAVLKKTKAAGNPVGIISNHAQPGWFNEVFSGSGVQFIQSVGRQSGKIVSFNAKKFSLQAHDVLVLAGNEADLHMGKNGGAVLLAAGWSTSPQVKSLGIEVASGDELQDVIDLTAGWQGKWWFSGDRPCYRVRALTDLSQYQKALSQQVFAEKVKATAKGGGTRLVALLAVTARSLLTDGTGSQRDTLWGVYPSSTSANNDQEVLSAFTHRLRTTVSRVRHAKRGEPLFIRHKPSVMRHAGGAGDRTDPAGQVTTLHLNPFYKTHGRVMDKHVIVIDDCTTYGVSFGVAAAFLRKAGAASVTGVALGKFGKQLRYYEIDIGSDPFAPVATGLFSVAPAGAFPGVNDSAAQETLLKLIP